MLLGGSVEGRAHSMLEDLRFVAHCAISSLRDGDTAQHPLRRVDSTRIIQYFAHHFKRRVGALNSILAGIGVFLA